MRTCAQALLDAGKDINSLDYDSHAPLHYAAWEGPSQSTTCHRKQQILVIRRGIGDMSPTFGPAV